MAITTVHPTTVRPSSCDGLDATVRAAIAQGAEWYKRVTTEATAVAPVPSREPVKARAKRKGKG